jgi:methyl-accepting chemotaxis protein
MFNDLSIGKRMLVACSVVVLLFSTTFVLVGISLANLGEDVKRMHDQTQIAATQYQATSHMADSTLAGILEASRSATNMMIIGGGISALMAAIFGVWIVLGLKRQLGGDPAYVAEIVSRVAAGDLTVRVRGAADDTASLLSAVRNMVDNLTALHLNVQTNSDNVNASSRQIASGNAELSRRTEEQAAILEETAASMEELLAAVQRNTETARLASQLAQGANDIAEESGRSVEMLVATMAAINESSRRIEDITSVIDGIAFQTNILALNAAVEAARAGDQGRGFAVVAGEVRSLAQRSATAAKEIKSLIGDSVSKVNAGSRQVKDAADGIGDVVTSVHLVATQMKDISGSTTEQGVSIDQVNRAMTRMDTVTQQNAALVEQAALAAEAMQEQAAALMVAVSMFKVESGRDIARGKRLPSAPQ